MIEVTIDKHIYSVPSDIPIIEACNRSKVYLPSLCYHPDLPPSGNCGFCAVKIDGALIAYACMTKVRDGMVISTTDPDLFEKNRKGFDSFIDIANPPPGPDIEAIVQYFFKGKRHVIRAAERTPALIFTPEECVSCGRCERVCGDVLDLGALDTQLSPLKSGPCVSCGQCTLVCPTRGLIETSDLALLWRSLASGKILGCIVDPAACVGANEAFDLSDKIGANVTGKVVGGLRELGFKYVFDGKMGIDIATIEIVEELLSRGEKPFILSVCPALVNFVEKNRTDLLDNLSKVKSPSQILGEVILKIFLPNNQIPAENLVLVLLTSCIASKSEYQRSGLKGTIDLIMTVREFSTAMRQSGLDWTTIKPSTFEDNFTAASARSAFTSMPGGWTRSFLSTLYERDNKTSPPAFDNLRPGDGSIRMETIKVGRRSFTIAICDGLAAGREFLAVPDLSPVDLLEINVCPRGCAFGGGQPKLASRDLAANRFLSVDNIASGIKSISAQSILPEIERITGASIATLRSKLIWQTEFTRQVTATPPKRRRSDVGLPIVAYGSTGGQAKGYARLVAVAMSTASVSMNRLSIGDLFARGNAIFIVSNWGDNEFPVNARKFAGLLSDTSIDLSAVNFAILALKRGSDEAPTAGARLAALLEARGAQQIAPIRVADTLAADSGDGSFNEWTASISSQFSMQTMPIGLRRLSTIEAAEEEDGSGRQSLRPRGYELAQIVEVNLLSPEDFHPAMHRIVFRIPEGLTYETGDQITLIPRNEVPMVQQVIDALKMQPGKQYTIEGDPLIPGRLSLRELFSQYLDLNGLPPRTLLRAFYDAANASGKAILGPLVDPKSDRAFAELCLDTNVAECLCEFSKYGIPPLDVLISAMPRMEPRLYAIASVPEVDPTLLDILVLEVLFGKDFKRKGLTTHFLISPMAKMVPLRTKKGTLKYPRDPTSPMIMCALGAGLSPMLALLIHRMNIAPNFGPALLFAGVRFKLSFPLLFRKVGKMVDQGILEGAWQAVSREPPANHIQDLIRENSGKIWDLWQDPRTHFYFCGPKRGCVDDLKEIMVDITVTEGWLSREEAMAFCSRHEWRIEEG